MISPSKLIMQIALGEKDLREVLQLLEFKNMRATLEQKSKVNIRVMLG